MKSEVRSREHRLQTSDFLLQTSLSRRDFLSAALLSSTLLAQAAAPARSARLLGIVPLGEVGGRTPPPFGRLLGAGLDARLFTDLSTLGDSLSPSNQQSTFNQQSRSNQQSSISNHQFFIRTAAPKALAGSDPGAWSIRVDGLVESPSAILLRSVERDSISGRFLLECSGNVDQSSYGLISTADWAGIPLAPQLDRIRASRPGSRILIEGLDDDASPGGTSVPGASWIFGRDVLDRAVLALRMNDAALPPDHGAPVRLLVPGWYGCACIKWVTRIALVAADAPATSQMLEFAARTHQDPSARLARDFAPATIDTAAMPVRVEKWVDNGRISYRIVGILWGGTRPTDALSIRFKSGQPWVHVDDCPLPASTLTWSFWTHIWRPETPGRYQIVLRVDDPSIRTRRLDLFYYVREIQIDEV